MKIASNSSRAQRLRVTGLSRTLVMGVSLTVAAVTWIICFLFKVGIDRSLGFSGVVLAITTFLLSQWQASGPRNRKIILVAKSKSQFGMSINRGITEILNAYGSLSIETRFPEKTASVAWQVAQLQSPSVVQADGLIIVPAADDERIWTELIRLTRRGVFVVVMDVKPPNRTFSKKGAARPTFVGSDFAAGGKLVGTNLRDQLLKSSSARAFILCGPPDSWPGLERSRNIVHELAVGDVAKQASFRMLPDWDKDVGANLILEWVLDQVFADDVELFIFCGNDKILIATHLLLVRHMESSQLLRIFLIGYDGATSDGGDYIVDSCAMTLFTVDTKPDEQGKTAAQVLIDEHTSVLNDLRSFYVLPVIHRSKLEV